MKIASAHVLYIETITFYLVLNLKVNLEVFEDYIKTNFDDFEHNYQIDPGKVFVCNLIINENHTLNFTDLEELTKPMMKGNCGLDNTIVQLNIRPFLYDEEEDEENFIFSISYHAVSEEQIE